MEEVVVRMRVSEDLAKEFRSVSKSEWSLAVSKLLKDKVSRISRLERLLKKSRLSEEKAKEISDKIDESLAVRYDELYKKTYG
jgi:CO/xanthine dehydrogenase FAD-binding subunit